MMKTEFYSKVLSPCKAKEILSKLEDKSASMFPQKGDQYLCFRSVKSSFPKIGNYKTNDISLNSGPLKFDSKIFEKLLNYQKNNASKTEYYTTRLVYGYSNIKYNIYDDVDVLFYFSFRNGEYSIGISLGGICEQANTAIGRAEIFNDFLGKIEAPNTLRVYVKDNSSFLKYDSNIFTNSIDEPDKRRFILGQTLGLSEQDFYSISISYYNFDDCETVFRKLLDSIETKKYSLLRLP